MTNFSASIANVFNVHPLIWFFPIKFIAKIVNRAIIIAMINVIEIYKIIDLENCKVSSGCNLIDGSEV